MTTYEVFLNVWSLLLCLLVALFLASCAGAGSSDNGVYVFEPTSEEMLEMAEKRSGTNSAANLFVDQLKVKVKLEIKDNTGKLSASVSMFGNKPKRKSVDIKVDQKNKSFSLVRES